MTSQNPNNALDKIKKEKMPIFELFEKFIKSPNKAIGLFKKIDK